MDKKEYNAAFNLIDSEKCRQVLKGLIEIKGNDWLDVVDQLQSYVAGYEKAKVAVENLAEVLRLVIESANPQIIVEPAFARGLEYYTGVIFEIYVPQLEIALGGGGRYDRLIEAFGGEPTPAVGCAHGIDRVAIALQAQKTALNAKTEKKVAVIPVVEALKFEALRIAQILRSAGLTVEFEVMGRKMGKALEDANKRRADFAVIVGEKELRGRSVVLKDLANRTQNTISLEKLVEKLES
jgi:histidyl-tRNA synthetase